MTLRIGRFLLFAVVPAIVAGGCGGQTQSTKTHDTSTHQSTSGAQPVQYHPGQRCRQSLAFAYSAKGFTCVNGRLYHKGSQSSPRTVSHHHAHTTTAAPQGY
ncbi:MAG TPA: hypothetical protein VGL78_03490 [Solirubrobacteraceae bacterium]|jgi:hypothetical protein